MGWFARYGIPGTYFVLDSMLWILILVPKINHVVLEYTNKDDGFLPLLGALLALSSLPFGYILTIIQQYFYLGKKRRKGGLYKRAVRALGQDLDESYDEAVIEQTVFSQLYLSEAYRYLPRDWDDNIKFVRTWVEKRMDILVINRTVRLATALALGPAAVICALLWDISLCRSNIISAIILIVLSLLLFLLLYLSTKKLEEQLVYVLSRFYRKNNIVVPEP